MEVSSCPLTCRTHWSAWSGSSACCWSHQFPAGSITACESYLESVESRTLFQGLGYLHCHSHELHLHARPLRPARPLHHRTSLTRLTTRQVLFPLALQLLAPGLPEVGSPTDRLQVRVEWVGQRPRSPRWRLAWGWSRGSSSSEGCPGDLCKCQMARAGPSSRRCIHHTFCSTPNNDDDDTKNLPHSGYRAGASDLWWRSLTRSFRCTKSPRCPSRRSCHRLLRSIGRAGTVCLFPSRACRREAGFSTFRVPLAHLSWI